MDHIEVPMPTPTEHEQLIDTTAAAARLGVKPITMRIWRWRDTPHQPPYTRVGRRHIRYSPAVLDAWLASRTHKPGTSRTRNRRKP
jgi:hypothetical protein